MTISVVIVAARTLTLARLMGIPLFAWWLLGAEPGGAAGPALFVFYLFFPLSDLVDGPLARWAGGARPLWGRLDALADIAFNTSSLLAAAWAGWVGPWAPASVAVLGGRFLWRGPERGSDPWGRAAGVLFYLLTGAVAAGAAFTGGGWRWWTARAGEAVALYALMVLLRGMRAGPGARRGRSTPGGGR
ncbi:MAG: CDP-alcohol phosphatidyltransferase family protein [Nitrospinota bacterium]